MMSRFAVLICGLAMLGFVLTLSGCSQEAGSPQTEPAGAVDEHGHEHGAGTAHQHAADAPDEGEGQYEAVLAQLSEADRALAEKQKICPVSGQALGSMGKPYKVTVKGREVLLCCPGCEDAIKKEPDKYLAKLNP